MHAKFFLAVKCLSAAVVLSLIAWMMPTDASSEWQTARSAGYKLHYGQGKAADAAVIGTFFETAYARIAREFQKHRPSDLLEGIELDVYLHPEAGEMASTEHATMTSNLQKDGYKAAIHMLTPAAYGNGDPGSPQGAEKKDYLFKQVVHEVSAVYVQRLILGKPKGWRYDQAAPWFLQGYDEYLAGIHGRRAEDATLSTYREQIRRDPGRVRIGASIRVRDPYADGAVVVEFLHDSFGRDAVQNIWLSPEPTFDQALLSALNTSSADLQTRWRTWLNKL